MLLAYNPSLCRKLILTLCIFAAIVSFATFVVTSITLSSDEFYGSVTYYEAVGFIIVTMFILTLLNKLQLASVIWAFTMPAVINWVIYTSDFELDVLSVLIIILIIVGILLPTRLVIISGLFELGFFLVISVLTLLNPTSSDPADLPRSIVINAFFILFTTVIMATLDEGMIRVVLRAEQQAQALQQANATLKAQQTQQQQVGEQVSQLAHAISSVFHEQKLMAQEQASLVKDVANVAQEVDSAAYSIADNAISVALAAERAFKCVETGRKMAEDSTQAILVLRNRVEYITENMRNLNTQIEQIGEVTDIIGEIASETQLLALNATIEAAGAREFGRRFGVVADEVNRLSKRVSESVAQIQDTVTEITKASNKSLTITEEGLQQAKHGTELVEGLNATNNTMVQLVDQTSMLANNIATVTQQQYTASNHIVGVVRTINTSTNRLNYVSTEVLSLVLELEETLKRMNNTKNYRAVETVRNTVAIGAKLA